MKVLMKEIEVLAWFHKGKDEHPKPLRIRLEDENAGNIVIKVNNVLSSEYERLAGNRMILYKCQNVINNVEKIFELKYELMTYKWYLYKW